MLFSYNLHLLYIPNLFRFSVTNSETWICVSSCGGFRFTHGYSTPNQNVSLVNKIINKQKRSSRIGCRRGILCRFLMLTCAIVCWITTIHPANSIFATANKLTTVRCRGGRGRRAAPRPGATPAPTPSRPRRRRRRARTIHFAFHIFVCQNGEAELPARHRSRPSGASLQRRAARRTRTTLPPDSRRHVLAAPSAAPPCYATIHSELY